MSAQLGFADKTPSRAQRGKFHDTRIGGLPVYFEGLLDLPPRPICTSCLKPLYLVAQIYAPTDRDRSLLIWGCNSVACNKLQPAEKSAQLGSWCVQRTQSSMVHDAPASVVTETEVEIPAPPDPWGACAAWGDEPAALTGANSSVITCDILPEFNVHQVPEPLHVSAPEAGPEHTRHARLDILPTPTDKFRFPAFNVWTATEDDDGSGTAEEDSDEENTDSALCESADIAARRWREYELWRSSAGEEEAPGVADTEAGFSDDEEGGITGQEDADGGDAAEISGVWCGPGGGKGSSATLKHVDRKLKKVPQCPDSSKRKGKRVDASEPSGGGGRVAGGDEYEATPAELRYMLRFQAWLRRAGHPCMRYAYGLSPRWPAVPASVMQAGVPRCPCGREREFELQLLPALLVILMVDEHTDASLEDLTGAALVDSLAAARITSPDGREVVHSSSAGAPHPSVACQWGGMDFSSVLVFSCPDSCAVSDTEFAIVVPNH